MVSVTSLLADPLRWLSVLAWLFCLACLSPAIVRQLSWRGRYLDPIWCVVFLLGLNRLSFLLRLPIEGSRGTALALAIGMGLLSVSYQRRDAVPDLRRAL